MTPSMLEVASIRFIVGRVSHPRSARAAAARCAQISYGMSSEPVKATRSPGERVNWVGEDGACGSSISERMRVASTSNVAAMSMSRWRSSPVITPSAHASMTSWRVNSSLIARGTGDSQVYVGGNRRGIVGV